MENKFGVKLEHKQTYQKSLFFGIQNTYILWNGVNDYEFLKLDGTQDNYPEWMRDNINDIAKHIMTNPKDDRALVEKINKIFSDLDNGCVKATDLRYTEKLGKNPTDYKNNDKKKIIGLEQNKVEGDVITYYDCERISKSKGGNNRTWTTNYNEISLDEYKQVLWKKVLPMLEIAGYDVKQIKSELNFN